MSADNRSTTSSFIYFRLVWNMRIIDISNSLLGIWFFVFQPGSAYKSDFLVINPDERLSVEGQTFTVQLMVEEMKALEIVSVYYSSLEYNGWTKLEDVEIKDDWATMEASSGGTYVVTAQPNAGAIAGIVIAVLAAVALIVVGVVVYLRKNPEAAAKVTRPFKNQI